jgi:hypothetical protein
MNKYTSYYYSKLNKILHKREEADGALTYAFCFIALIITITVFLFMIFNWNVVVVEETLETRMHTIESAALSVNQDRVISGSREDTFEQELARMHVVRAVELSNAWSSDGKEQQEAYAVAEFLSDNVIADLYLNSHATSDAGILNMMCGADTKVNLTGANIYEPIYNVEVSRYATGNPDEPYEFDIQYHITGWVKYTCVYSPSDNSLASVTKTVCSGTPVLVNGTNAEGATVEMSIALSFNGIRNLFYNVNNAKPTTSGTAYFDDNGNLVDNYVINYNGAESDLAMFSGENKYTQYDVIVTQAVDIVNANYDSRIASAPTEELR